MKSADVPNEWLNEWIPAWDDFGECVKMSDRLKFDLFYIFKTCLTVCKQMKIFQLSKNVETVQVSFCEESACLCDTLQSNERSTFIVQIQ